MATQWAKSTVVELRAELKRRGLPQTGKKAELVSRLTEADLESAAAENNDDGGEEEEEEEEEQSQEETVAADATIPAQNTTEEPREQPIAPPEIANASVNDNSSEEKQPEDEKTVEATASDALDAPAAAERQPGEAETAVAIEIAPQPVTENSDARDAPSGTLDTEKEENNAQQVQQVQDVQPTVSVGPPVVEVVADARNRKRRSHSPPPAEEEVSRKRARRPSDEEGPGGIVVVDDSQTAGESRPADVNNREDTLEQPAASEKAPGVEDVSYAEISENRVAGAEQQEKQQEQQEEQQQDVVEADEAQQTQTQAQAPYHPKEDDVEMQDDVVPDDEAKPRQDQDQDQNQKQHPEDTAHYDEERTENVENAKNEQYQDRDQDRDRGQYRDHYRDQDYRHNAKVHLPVDRGDYRAHRGDNGHVLDYDDYHHDVTPALHAATPALYIKNFMRPLREPVLKDHLIDLATAPGSEPDDGVIVDFFLDQIRTHAFVELTSIAAASRVRIALHGKVWPDERNRRELWVDFIPPEKVREWREQETSGGGGRGMNRWEVQYEPDHEGNMTATLVEASGTDSARPAARLPPPAPAAAAAVAATGTGTTTNTTAFGASKTIPTGPAARSNFPGIERAPRGPRGRGRGQPEYATEMLTTRAHPPINYRPVDKQMADRRMANMNSYVSKDRHRDLGRMDEINRYTFEDNASFVDRGKEIFVGIRPPHRERERRRAGGGGRGFPPMAMRPGSDRYIGSGGGGGGGGGGRDSSPRRDVPRSRFNGEPLPTFSDFRSDRRGGGGRRNNRNGGGRY